MNMNKDLAYEKSQMPLANKWYKENFKATKIKRYGYELPEDIKMQDDDIDCTITVPELTNPNVNVSEKFRTADWGDIWIELYSNYNKKTKGSYMKSKATKLAYFTPKYVYIVPMALLKDLAYQLFNMQEVQDVLANMNFSHTKSTKVSLLLENEKINATVTMSPSIRNGHSWIGAGVCINWADLKKINISYKRFKR